MAASIIYTGQNEVTPTQDQNLSLQALSQFGRSQADLKKTELAKAVKDRDTFLEMMKLDPVYLSNRRAMDLNAQDIQQFQNAWTDINRKKNGRLTTSDYAELQNDRALVMAKIGKRKALNDEALRAQQTIAARPDQYSRDMFEKSMLEYAKDPDNFDGTFLYPAYKDPAQVWMQDKTVVPTWDEQYETKGNFTSIKRVPIYPESITDAQGNQISLDEYKQQRALDLYRPNDMMQYWYAIKFASLPPSEQKYYADAYLKEGYKDPVEAYAISEAKGLMWTEKPKAAGTRLTPRERTPSQGLIINANGLSIGTKNTNYVTYSDNVVSSMLGTGRGVEFNDKYAPLMQVPADKLKFNEDIRFKPGASVWVRPSKMVGNDVEYAVDPSRNKDTYKIVYSYDKVPMDRWDITPEDYFIDEATGKKAWMIPIKTPTNIQAVGTIDDVIDKINVGMNNLFKSWYLDKFNPSGNDQNGEQTYTLPGSKEQYTKQELLDNGWTEADIKRLK